MPVPLFTQWSQMLTQLGGVRWFSLYSQHWTCVMFLSRIILGCVLSTVFQQLRGEQNFYEGFFLLWFVFKKNPATHLCFLAACVKSQNPLMKASRKLYSLLETHKWIALLRNEFLIATAFSHALVLTKELRSACIYDHMFSLNVFRSRMQIAGAAEGWTPNSCVGPGFHESLATMALIYPW